MEDARVWRCLAGHCWAVSRDGAPQRRVPIRPSTEGTGQGGHLAFQSLMLSKAPTANWGKLSTSNLSPLVFHPQLAKSHALFL